MKCKCGTEGKENWAGGKSFWYCVNCKTEVVESDFSGQNNGAYPYTVTKTPSGGNYIHFPNGISFYDHFKLYS